MQPLSVKENVAAFSNSLWETTKNVAEWVGHTVKVGWEKSLPFLKAVRNLAKVAFIEIGKFFRTYLGLSLIAIGVGVGAYSASSSIFKGDSVLNRVGRGALGLGVGGLAAFTAGWFANEAQRSGNTTCF